MLPLQGAIALLPGNQDSRHAQRRHREIYVFPDEETPGFAWPNPRMPSGTELS